MKDHECIAHDCVLFPALNPWICFICHEPISH